MKKLYFCEDRGKGVEGEGDGTFPKRDAVFNDLRRLGFGYSISQAIQDNVVVPHTRIGHYNASGNATVISVPDDYVPSVDLTFIG